MTKIPMDMHKQMWRDSADIGDKVVALVAEKYPDYEDAMIVFGMISERIIITTIRAAILGGDEWQSWMETLLMHIEESFPKNLRIDNMKIAITKDIKNG